MFKNELVRTAADEVGVNFTGFTTADAGAEAAPTKEELDALYEAFLIAWKAMQDASSDLEVARARYNRNPTQENADAISAASSKLSAAIDAFYQASEAYEAAKRRAQ